MILLNLRKQEQITARNVVDNVHEKLIPTFMGRWIYALSPRRPEVSVAFLGPQQHKPKVQLTYQLTTFVVPSSGAWPFPSACAVISSSFL